MMEDFTSVLVVYRFKQCCTENFRDTLSGERNVIHYPCTDNILNAVLDKNKFLTPEKKGNFNYSSDCHYY